MFFGEIITNLFDTIVYSLLGLVLMIVGYRIFDKVTPYDISNEFKEKNPAIGAVVAGMFIAIAIIIRAVIV